MTSDRESVEKDRHDFTASELTDLRGIHESAMEALRAANAAVEESIRIQRRAMAAIDKFLREATGRPRGAPTHSKPLGTCGVMPENPHPFDQDACVGWTRVSAPEASAEQIETDRMERRGGR